MKYEIIIGLCHLAVGGMSVDPEKVDKAQLKCQQYYVSCIKSKVTDTQRETAIQDCIMERKVD